MSMLKEFRAFALKGNVVDLAVAVVIGTAFGKIVSAVVDDLVMPIVGVVLPAGDWREWKVTSLDLAVGHLLGEMLDFIIVAFVLFLVVHRVMKVVNARLPKDAPPASAPTRACPECLETILAAARRCRSCGSPVAVVAA